MNFDHVFSDDELKQEFLDTFERLVSPASGGLEGLAMAPTVDAARSAADQMSEGTWGEGQDPGLEAIVQRFTRPVYLVQDSTFDKPGDDFKDSEMIARRLGAARDNINAGIPSVGRIDLRNHRQAWVGTGWMVAPGVVATNRHVAEEFARPTDKGFGFRQNFNLKTVRANIDWRREHGRPSESLFKVTDVLWIEPEPSFDIALLKIADPGEDDESAPTIIELAEGDDADNSLQRWISVIGYPARDSRNNMDDQQRIFDGIYNVKRLAPGQVTAVRGDGLLEHDATTLGGNSGSVVLDIESGKALGIHFGGIEASENYAVSSKHLAALVKAHC